MEAPFLGFSAKALEFFAAIEANNSKETFTDWKPVYENEVKEPIFRLLSEVAAEYGGSVRTFRPHRDTRFSKDKSPYKTNAAGYVAAPDRYPLTVYVSLSGQGLHVVTGAYKLGKEQLAAFRDAVASQDGEEFAALIEEAKTKGFEPWGDAVATAPRGFAKDHPRIDLLRFKDFLLGKRLGPKETLDGRKPLEFALASWEALRPATEWMAERIGQGSLPDD